MRKKRKQKKKTGKAPVTAVLIFRIWMAFSAFFVLTSAILITVHVLYIGKKAAAAGVAQNYTNPELGKVRELKPASGGAVMDFPGHDKLKLVISDKPVFGGNDRIFALSVCRTGGHAREYYTEKMPWELIMYKYEPELATVTVFDIDRSKKTGKFEIIILDPKADASRLRSVSVRIFTELLKNYMPGIIWNGSVRQEIG
jgi:hypothetical protein